jgi:ATP-dependent DNA ligase
MALPFYAPLEPMLASAADTVPSGEGWHYEPKWDGFRVLLFRDGDRVHLQGRDLQPLERYFPDLVEAVRRTLPPAVVIDGEIVIAGERGLDFEALLERIHPAAAHVAQLAARTPAALVAWDLLALGDEDLRYTSLWQRRRRLEQVLGQAAPPVFLTPATRDPAVALDWFARFEGAGLDGVVAKRFDEIYRPGERVMVKVKHQRTAECVVGGFRWHRGAPGSQVGSLLLGLYDRAGHLRHVGIAAGFTLDRRRALTTELSSLRDHALDGHPWHDWGLDLGEARWMPGGATSWTGREAWWEPLRPLRVCEVVYDHLQGDRFRNPTRFLRWRPDKRPADCGFEQLGARPAPEIARIYASARDRPRNGATPMGSGASEGVARLLP